MHPVPVTGDATRRRIVIAVLLLAIGLVSVGVGGSFFQTRDRQGSTRTSADLAVDLMLPEVCSAEGIECSVSPDGLLAVMRRPSRQTSDVEASTLTLMELGGPGIDALQVLDYLPKWSHASRVLILPEPWTYRTDEFCARYSCATDAQQADVRVRLARYAESTWGRVGNVYAFSFGAVLALPLAQSSDFRDARFWFVAPAPVPNTSIQLISRLRLSSTIAAMSRVACGGDAGCVRESTNWLRRVARGRAGIGHRDGFLGLLSVGATASRNEYAVMRIVESRPTGKLTPRAVRILREGAFTFQLSGAERSIVLQRAAYSAGMCAAYSGWRKRDQSPLASLSSCTGGRPVMYAKPAAPVVADEIRIGINSADPVVPAVLQRQWQHLAPQARTVVYRENSHVAGESPILHP